MCLRRCKYFKCAQNTRKCWIIQTAGRGRVRRAPRETKPLASAYRKIYINNLRKAHLEQINSSYELGRLHAWLVQPKTEDGKSRMTNIVNSCPRNSSHLSYLFRHINNAETVPDTSPNTSQALRPGGLAFKIDCKINWNQKQKQR